MAEDIFNQIINKKLPSLIVYEDKFYIAILDISPKQQGHTLLIPKETQENIFNNSQNVKESIINIAQKISTLLMKNLNASGVKLVSNIGTSAGQVVFHTHLHIIPYYDHEVDKINNQEVLDKILK